MLPLTCRFVQPFLDRYEDHVDRAGLPGGRPWALQPKVSWQHRNGAYLLLELLQSLQELERSLAPEQESCHTV